METPRYVCRRSLLARVSRLASLVLLLSVTALAQNDPNRKDWVSIFNGKSLDGWVIKLAHHDLEGQLSRYIPG